ncbi:MAG TPA: sensor histidine kinase [Ignavibacteria bacterium]|jgi:signal transduction histidine kinase|nr:sensor histidine kinase [Ignavibacteria bacterium]
MQDQNPEIYFVIIIGIVLGLLLVGFIVTILFLYQRRKYRQEQELAKLKDTYDREALRSQLEIQENTFKTISQELHDNIGQMLSVVKLSLSVLPMDKDHPAYEPLQQSRMVLNKAIIDLSDLTKSLHSDRIAELGLPESVRFELASVKKAGIVDTTCTITGTEFSLNSQKEIFLFRIFQELLHNILKHAKATRIIVHLTYSLDGIFTMEVKDNGIGFDLEAKRNTTAAGSGVGLKSLLNRSKLIGATLTIESEPGKGTAVFVRLPPQAE